MDGLYGLALDFTFEMKFRKHKHNINDSLLNVIRVVRFLF